MKWATQFGALLCVLAVLGSANAAIIDMEGIAPAGGIPMYGTVNVDGYTFSGSHFHLVDSAWPTSGWADNGTDYLLADASDFTLTSPIGTFSIQSFQATEYHSSHSSPTTITVTGNVFGGGTLTANFVTPARGVGGAPNFQPFTFDPGWTNLTSVVFEGGIYAYDNIQVDEAATTSTPEPASLAIWGGIGLAGIAATRRRKRRQSA